MSLFRKNRFLFLLTLAGVSGLVVVLLYFPLSPIYLDHPLPTKPVGPRFIPLEGQKISMRLEGPETGLEEIRALGGSQALRGPQKTPYGVEFEASFSDQPCAELQVGGADPSNRISFPSQPFCTQPTRMVFLADTQNGPNMRYRKLDEILAFAPQLLLFGGDAVQFPARGVLWKRTMVALGPILRSSLFLAVAGNHDTMAWQYGTDRAADWYLGTNGHQKPRLFQFGKLAFLLIDYGTPEEDILQSLDRLSGPYPIVIMHAPLLTHGYHYAMYGGRLTKAFAGKAALVLAGHNHTYEHFVLDGTHFMTISSFGAIRYDPRPAKDPSLVKADCCADTAFLELTPQGLSIRVRNLVKATTVDEFVILPRK